MRRTLVSLLAASALALAGGCRRASPASTSPVLLAEGTVSGQPWRLVGRLSEGQPCASLFLAGADQPAAERCGVQRNALRHLVPVVVSYGGRLLVFSPLPAGARRVRLDAADGSIRIEPAAAAPGYPARYFLIDADPAEPPLEVRAFSNKGRPVVT